MEIWLIRHGTTTANREGRFQGRLDFPLSPQGRQEAKRLARRLSSTGLEVILSSDLSRAWDTAEIIARETGLQPVRIPLLRECSWGLIEGLTRVEVNAIFRRLPVNKHGALMASVFGGEGDRRLLARAGTMFKHIHNRYGRHSRIALVSHGRFINALLAACLGLKSRQRWPFTPSPASLSMIKYESLNERYHLELFNDRCHLS